METATLRPKKSKKSGKARKTRATCTNLQLLINYKINYCGSQTDKVGWGGGRSMGTYRGGRKSIGQAMVLKF